MAKHFKTPEGDAGLESTGRFEPLPAQTTAPHRRSWDDGADVTASGPAVGGTISDVATSGSAAFSMASGGGPLSVPGRTEMGCQRFLVVWRRVSGYYIPCGSTPRYRA